MLPDGLVAPLGADVSRCAQHEADLRQGAGWVELPDALRRKYPNAGREWPWLETGYDIWTIQELLGHRDATTPMIYTHVLNRGGLGVRSPFDATPRRRP